jgi:hypothetical protein
MPVEQLRRDGRAQRRTSASARIRCGTLASDAMRVKPAAQERQTQTAARDRVACFTPRPRDLQATEHQVEGGGVNDSCCSYTAHRVFASDEVRGGTMIPHKSASVMLAVSSDRRGDPPSPSSRFQPSQPGSSWPRIRQWWAVQPSVLRPRVKVRRRQPPAELTPARQDGPPSGGPGDPAAGQRGWRPPEPPPRRLVVANRAVVPCRCAAGQGRWPAPAAGQPHRG